MYNADWSSCNHEIPVGQSESSVWYVRPICPGCFSSIPDPGTTGAQGLVARRLLSQVHKISQIYCIIKSRFFIFHKSLLIRGFCLNSNAKNFRTYFNFCYESLCEFFLRIIFIKIFECPRLTRAFTSDTYPRRHG